MLFLKQNKIYYKMKQKIKSKIAENAWLLSFK